MWTNVNALTNISNTNHKSASTSLIWLQKNIHTSTRQQRLAILVHQIKCNIPYDYLVPGGWGDPKQVCNNTLNII